jgi:uncharacterized protein (TIGR02452 family)
MSTAAHEQALALAERAERIMREERYARVGGADVDLREDTARAVNGTELVRPADWTAIIAAGSVGCTAAEAGVVAVTAESTLAALQRLVVGEGKQHIAALNFASARNPGGGWRNGALAQEETLARASCLVRSLTSTVAADYYRANRAQAHLFYTEHAIWTPEVPFFADADGELLGRPYRAGVVTMPAPNIGAMMRLSEHDVLALPQLWRDRIERVLALAIAHGVRHLVLGAWGCGAFGNDPASVAQRFAEVLAPPRPWLRGLESVTFAIYETSRRRPCLPAFARALAPLTGGQP